MLIAALFFLLAFSSLVDDAGYKIALFGVQAVGSQIIFNSRVAEELADAGHNVTLYFLRYSNAKVPTIPLKANVNSRIVQMVPDDDPFSQIEMIQKETLFAVTGRFDSNMRKILPMMSRTFVGGCEKMLQNKKFLDDLRNEKFDLAFTPIMDLCFTGLVHHFGIPSWIWLSSAALTDTMAAIVGVPSPPSYVPSIAQAATDQMSFFQRVISFAISTIQFFMWQRFIIDPQTALFRKHIDPNFPDLMDLGRQCQLVMVNSNELYDLARPTLHKIVYIGGIGMKPPHKAKSLDEPFKSLLENHDRIVLMSFGSIANASLMPKEWKTALLEAFRQFPDYHFIMRYDQSDLKNVLPSNVHTFPWLPQQDLMQNEKVKALIAHGGYNSMQEAINAGKPIIAIPLFGDQPRNALLIQKLGIGTAIEKAEISTGAIVSALNSVLNDDRYKNAAEQLHKMVLMKPIPPEQLLIKWTEFVAEFKQLPNLTPYGINLNFMQYFSLDVIGFLFAITAMVVFIFFRLVKFLYRRMRHFFTNRLFVKEIKKSDKMKKN